VRLPAPLALRNFFSLNALSTCDQMGTIRLSFVEGIDRKIRQTQNSVLYPLALLPIPQGYGMGSGGRLIQANHQSAAGFGGSI
jgi:hypothetical protein